MSYIVPISSNMNPGTLSWVKDATEKLNSIDGGNENAGAGAAEAGSFRSILNDVVNNVIETENQTKVDAYNLSIGNMDDMHTMMINQMKAEVALQTMVQLRNKMLDAYKEVMNTSL